MPFFMASPILPALRATKAISVETLRKERVIIAVLAPMLISKPGFIYAFLESGRLSRLANASLRRQLLS